MSERDPRIDPKVGDIVNKGKLKRIVTGRTMDVIGYIRREGEEWRSCWITTWRDWAKDAEVIHAAD